MTGVGLLFSIFLTEIYVFYAIITAKYQVRHKIHEKIYPIN